VPENKFAHRAFFLRKAFDSTGPPAYKPPPDANSAGSSDKNDEVRKPVSVGGRQLFDIVDMQEGMRGRRRVKRRD
jgi:hypothetical protein